jgi:hypothetical protein
MNERKPLIPRQRLRFEGEEADHAELCIRVMERFIDAANDDPKLAPLKIDGDLLGLYSDVLQEELGPYAFRLAYEMFSKSPSLVQKRAARLARDSASASDRRRPK